MAKKKELKTNAMRILESLGIDFQQYEYECKEFTDGIHAADELHLPHERVYKTLVAKGKGNDYYVFVIPVEGELDLKKAAVAVEEKSVSLIPVKEIQNVTGYIRGGCTAIGMKRKYPVRISQEAMGLSSIYISGGKIGLQIELSPEDFVRAAEAKSSEILKV